MLLSLFLDRKRILLLGEINIYLLQRCTGEDEGNALDNSSRRPRLSVGIWGRHLSV